MSADNIIYVKFNQKLRLWEVWHDFASNPKPKYKKGYCNTRWETKNEAIACAVGIEKGMDYVEYGISIVD